MNTLTPVDGATPRFDDDGREIVTVMTCGTCGRSWNDAAISSVTPTPSGRCPFEYEHEEPMPWVVIINTPGYMPDDDDPARFEGYEAAVYYLGDEVKRLVEHIEEGGGEAVVSWADDRSSAHVSDSTREHDLGRSFEIVKQEEEG